MDIYAICLTLWEDPAMRDRMYNCVYPEDAICKKAMLDPNATVDDLYNTLFDKGLLDIP